MIERALDQSALLIKRLTSLVKASLTLWDIPETCSVELINVSENLTFRVKDEDWRCIIRVHRENYHTRRAIECELAWSDALRKAGVVKTPPPINAKDGNPVQTVYEDASNAPRFLVMFEYVEGSQPDERQDLTFGFEELGEIAARLHLHSMHWQKPEPFERLLWNLETILGAKPTWGDWRAAPNVTPSIAALLEKVEATLKARLNTFGTSKQRYGLIHADMRLANLIMNQQGTHLIDFDDCGFGWYLYDFAAAISFIEDRPQIPELKHAWLTGYQRVRALTEEDIYEIDSFIMLRRLALLAWIGTHKDAPEPKALAPDFARVSAELGERYLTRFV